MITIIQRRLDKLRLIKTFHTKSSKSEYNQSLDSAMFLAEQGQLKRITGKYRTIFYKDYLDGKEKATLRFDFGPSKLGGVAAIDCTPFKLTDSAWVDMADLFQEIFGKGKVYKEFRIQLMELALDVRRPMSDFIFIAEGLSASNNYYLDKGTMYLGTKYGKRSFCIYDKAKQLSEKKDLTTPYPLTRIEARRRGMGVTLSKLISVPYPFGTLVVVPRANLEDVAKHHSYDKGFKAFLAAVSSGVTGQEAYRDQDAKGRKRLLKLLRPHALKLGKTTPKHWTQWIEGRLAQLGEKFNGC